LSARTIRPAEVLARRLPGAGNLTATEAEGWLGVCADFLRTASTPAERGQYAEYAWGFWCRARSSHDLDAFSVWLDEAAFGSEAAKTILLARLANTGGDHAQCRDRLRPHIDDPAFAEHREEMLLLIGMAETQLDDPEAEDTLKRLIADYPDSASMPRARMLLAWIFVMEGREKEAAEHLRLLLAANPDETLARRARQMLDGMERMEQPTPPATTTAPEPKPENEGGTYIDIF